MLQQRLVVAVFLFYTKIPLVSYNNYSGLKKQLKKKTSGIKTIMDCLYIIQNLLRSVGLERMAECLVYFFAHAEHELMEQYETIHKEFNIKS